MKPSHIKLYIHRNRLLLSQFSIWKLLQLFGLPIYALVASYHRPTNTQNYRFWTAYNTYTMNNARARVNNGYFCHFGIVSNTNSIKIVPNRSKNECEVHHSQIARTKKLPYFEFFFNGAEYSPNLETTSVLYRVELIGEVDFAHSHIIYIFVDLERLKHRLRSIWSVKGIIFCMYSLLGNNIIAKLRYLRI